MKYILIIAIFSSKGVDMQSIEFNTLVACKSAEQGWNSRFERYSGGVNSFAFCTEKG